MNKTQQRRVIDQAYLEIPDLQDGFREVKDRLFQLNVQSERGHRRNRRQADPLSVPAAARYFVVCSLLDGFARPDHYTVDDIVSIRNEFLYAQAYAKRFHKELEAWAAKWTEVFKVVDYAKLME